MTPLFWLLLLPAVLTFGLIAWLTVRVCEAVQRKYRRWLVRAEIAEMKARHVTECCRQYVSPHPHDPIVSTSNASVGYMVVGGTAYVFDADGVPRRKMTVADADRILTAARGERIH